MEFLPDSYIVIDTETTGLSREEDDIIELSALRVTDNIISGEWSMLIKPRKPIPDFITAINHIDDKMVKRCPSIAQVMPNFLSFIGRSTLMFHNAGYDTGMINAALERMGREPLSNNIVDTLTLARARFDKETSCSLPNMCAYFGIKNENAHRSLSDCKATKDLYDRLKYMPADGSAHGIAKRRNQ